MSNKQNDILREAFIENLREDFMEWAEKEHNRPDKFEYLADKYPHIFKIMLNEFMEEMEQHFNNQRGDLC